MVDKEIMEQFQIITAMIEQSRRHTEILIENTVTKRLDALTDGYKITHEKQYELERRIEKLEQALAELQNKIA